MSTAIALFFQIKTCGFYLPEEKGRVGGGDVPALAVWLSNMCLLCLILCCLSSKFKFNCHCFVTKTCQLLSQVSLSWHLIKCVNCACLNWQLKIQILMFGNKIGATNVSKGPIDNCL